MRMAQQLLLLIHHSRKRDSHPQNLVLLHPGLLQKYPQPVCHRFIIGKIFSKRHPDPGLSHKFLSHIHQNKQDRIHCNIHSGSITCILRDRKRLRFSSACRLQLSILYHISRLCQFLHMLQGRRHAKSQTSRNLILGYRSCFRNQSCNTRLIHPFRLSPVLFHPA